MSFSGRSFTDLHSLTRSEIEYVLARSAEIKAALAHKDQRIYKLAAGQDILLASIFFENSTRTNNSFAVAAKRLGIETVGFAGIEGTSVKKGESLEHTLDMFDSYGVDGVIMRHPLDGSARFAADNLNIPIFNAGDGKHEHPTQTILDLFTIKEQTGRLDNLDIGMAGDLKYGRTVHSLAVALAKFKDIRLHLFAHPAVAMPPEIIQFLESQGMRITNHTSLDDLMRVVDIHYQTRVQEERMDANEYAQAKAACYVTPEMLRHTKQGFGLMHPLPDKKDARSVDPVAYRMPQSIIKRQAGNGVPTRLVQIALSLGLLKDAFTGEAYTPPAHDERFYVERPLSEKPRKHDQHLLPVEYDGIAIDHLAPGVERRLTGLLVRDGELYRAGLVPRERERGAIKGMLMIEGSRELSDDELRTIAALSPGSRVNLIRDGHVVRKLELSTPPVVNGTFTCANTGCVTRPEYAEGIDAKFDRNPLGALQCHYCDHPL